MSVKVIAFFNNKGGVGKTSLVYHLSWMFAELGKRVLAVDLDPQANLSASFFDEDQLESLWGETKHRKTIFGALYPMKVGEGDVADPQLITNSYFSGQQTFFDVTAQDRLALIAGDMALSRFEDELSESWPKCLDRQPRAFRVMSAFWRIMQKGAENHHADLILIDLGPNLGAINRAALIASDFIVVPLAPDLYSLQGLSNLGPVLHDWRREWQDRFSRKPDLNFNLPLGNMRPLGYVVMQHSIRRDRPVKAYDKWIARIPKYYREFVLDEPSNHSLTLESDQHCFSLIKHYRSLMPLAQESRKPMFFLKPADGAIGAHANAVKEVYRQFEQLAKEISLRSKSVVS